MQVVHTTMAPAQTSVVLKSVTIATILCSSIVLTLFPLMIKRVISKCCLKPQFFGLHVAKLKKIIHQALDLLQAFAGGILLAAALMHLIPESSESISSSLLLISQSNSYRNSSASAITEPADVSWFVTFPWAMMLTGFGILLLFVLETMIINIHACLKHKRCTKCCAFFIKFASELMTWFSLSLHSLLVGIAFGAEEHEYRMWILFAAIVAHHFFESVALGLLLEKAFGEKKMLLVILFGISFSISVPMGIGLGMGISIIDTHPTVSLIKGLLLSFSAGALLYVALFENLLNHKHSTPMSNNHNTDTELHDTHKSVVPAEKVTQIPASSNCATLTVARLSSYITGFMFMSSLAAVE